jgi:hypothetical protein
MLMADFILIDGQLTPTDEFVANTTTPTVEPAPPPVTTDPGNLSGIIPNSIDMIWADNHYGNTGAVSNMPAGYGQFGSMTTQSPPKRMSDLKTWDNLNIWAEVEAAGDGTSCSIDINQATNTRVEIGWIRGYILRNGTWSKFTEAKKQIGAGHPSSSGDKASGSRLPCDASRYDYSKVSGIARTQPSGFYSVKPQGYIRWHGWAPQKNISNPGSVDAVFGEMYVRLVVDDPTKPDDRHLANYVVHISGDIRNNGRYVQDIGISRYKKVTNDWQPISIICGSIAYDKNLLEKNPPPFALEP